MQVSDFVENVHIKQLLKKDKDKKDENGSIWNTSNTFRYAGKTENHQFIREEKGKF
ncbi:MAG: hypothetical protein ACTS73_08955 [Arsenophonus sp. NEOnobi-MAG3]